VQDEAAAVETAALTGDSLRIRHPFAGLLGLDAALAHVNPLLAGPAPPALTEYALRYAESGRLDSGAGTGALLPRFARPGRRGQLPDDLADAFGAVVRVRGTEWDACDHVTLPAHARLTRPDRDGGLRVATTPMIREPEELKWEGEERGGLRFYRIHPKDSDATRERVERVIAGWDDHDVAIGLAPELCLSPALLESWQVALRTRARAATSRLRVVVAGSGNVDQTAPPVNAAVLLDARTGEPLVKQRKVHPFNFSQADLELWGLAGRLNAPIDEDLTRGERVCVVEAGGVRLAILVCEDLARLHAFSAQLHGHGVSLILVPVFARPTKDRRWERSRAEVYCDAIGSTVVVANSLVIASILETSGPVGAAIAVAPGQAAVGHASEADDVVVFALEGGLPRVEHERTGETA
jgi:predicted amidohydrolase